MKFKGPEILDALVEADFYSETVIKDMKKALSKVVSLKKIKIVPKENEYWVYYSDTPEFIYLRTPFGHGFQVVK